MPFPEYRDVLVRISGGAPGLNGQPPVREMEVNVDGSGVWKTQLVLDFDSLDPGMPEEYGKALGAQIGQPALLRAIDQAGFNRGGYLRLRLELEDDVRAPHWIRWERVWLPVNGEEWRIAVHPRIGFSRYIPVQQPDGDAPDATAFRLLYAVANPDGLEPCKQISVEAEISNFLKQFEDGPVDRRLQVTVAPGRSGIGKELSERVLRQGWQVAPGAATLQNISAQLGDRFHALHILAHGDFNPDTGVGSLLLESEAGGKELVKDTELQSWMTPDLQLVVFQSCLSAAAQAEGHAPFTGLAPRLVRLGVPAAVAMQDEVTMEDARTFFSEFYRTILDEGTIDVAVNNGRKRLIESADNDSWSIPALFSRLRGGRLWKADPLRQAVANALDNLPRDKSTVWMPIQAIEHTRGVEDYDPVVGASGPRFDFWARTCEATAVPSTFTILTGGRGFFKSGQLKRLFRETAAKFLQSAPNVPVPVIMPINDLLERGTSPWPALQRVWTGQAEAEDIPDLGGREFLFLLDGDEEMTGSLREEALEALKRLRAIPRSRICISAEEDTLSAFQDDFADATLIVAQPLSLSGIRSYLEELNSNVATALKEQISQRGYLDLACQPRFLQHMLELANRGLKLHSRRSILERIAGMYLAKADFQKIPRTCVEEALQRIAWQIQEGRGSDIKAAQLYPLLTVARGGREFGLYDLKRALVGDCQLLIPSGDEGVRFAFPGLQSYFAAQYLLLAPDQEPLLEDITASLGRLARLRRWEKVLILLASMVGDPGTLLRTILAGSSLMEGEQLFLAVQCYEEATADGKDLSGLDDVADQMIDSLIWRSGWDKQRSHADRHKALQGLIAMAVLYPKRRADIIPWLVKLSCDPVSDSTDETGKQCFDWPGLRQLAASGAARFPEETSRYIRDKRTDLIEPLEAWWRLTDEPKAMQALLLQDDPRVSVIAASALAQSGREQDRSTLLVAYSALHDRNVRWGIVDALGTADTNWITGNAVDPWVADLRRAKDEPDPERSEHICFLIQKTMYASSEARSFMLSCLLNGPPRLQGRALRALASLQDAEIEKWLRPLCEDILQGCAQCVDSSKMRFNAEQIEDATLQRAALEALGDIGDATSLEILRRVRSTRLRGSELKQFSFQVAEEMYWRLTGGLDRESCTAPAAQKSKEMNT